MTQILALQWKWFTDFAFTSLCQTPFLPQNVEMEKKNNPKRATGGLFGTFRASTLNYCAGVKDEYVCRQPSSISGVRPSACLCHASPALTWQTMWCSIVSDNQPGIKTSVKFFSNFAAWIIIAYCVTSVCSWRVKMTPAFNKDSRCWTWPPSRCFLLFNAL